LVKLELLFGVVEDMLEERLQDHVEASSSSSLFAFVDF